MSPLCAKQCAVALSCRNGLVRVLATSYDESPTGSGIQEWNSAMRVPSQGCAACKRVFGRHRAETHISSLYYLWEIEDTIPEEETV